MQPDLDGRFAQLANELYQLISDWDNNGTACQDEIAELERKYIDEIHDSRDQTIVEKQVFRQYSGRLKKRILDKLRKIGYRSLP